VLGLSCCVVVRDAGRCQGIKGRATEYVLFYFITSVMILNFIYAETVYMNVVILCTEKFILEY
jgi:hypothetical protein